MEIFLIYNFSPGNLTIPPSFLLKSIPHSSFPNSHNVYKSFVKGITNTSSLRKGLQCYPFKWAVDSGVHQQGSKLYCVLSTWQPSWPPNLREDYSFAKATSDNHRFFCWSSHTAL